MTEFTPPRLRLKVELSMLTLYIICSKCKLHQIHCPNHKNNTVIVSRKPENPYTGSFFGKKRLKNSQVRPPSPFLYCLSCKTTKPSKTSNSIFLWLIPRTIISCGHDRNLVEIGAKCRSINLAPTPKICSFGGPCGTQYGQGHMREATHLPTQSHLLMLWSIWSRAGCHVPTSLSLALKSVMWDEWEWGPI